MTIKGKLLRINGADLWVEEAGQGTVVVLLHSGMTDARMWDDQWEALSASYRVIRYDMRGYGRSSIPPEPFSHSEDLQALLDRLNVTSAVLVAVSAGGEVALAFALDNPGRVDGLVLGGTLAGTASRSDALRKAWREVNDAFDAGDFDRATELEIRLWVDGPSRSPEAVDPQVRQRVHGMDLALLARAEEQDRATEVEPAIGVRDRLEEIECPVLVLYGALDMPDVLVSAQALLTNIPDAREVVFPTAAHFPSLEQPVLFLEAVERFLNELATDEEGYV